MFDFGKFINDIGSGVNNFFNPKKKREDELLPVRSAKPQATLQVAQPKQQQPNLQVAAPDFSNRFQNDMVNRNTPRNPGIQPAIDQMQAAERTPRVQGQAAMKTLQAPAPIPKSRVAADGTIIDTRPTPARVPNDDFDKANRVLKYSGTVRDKDNYVKSDADKLREELQKPNPNAQLVRGLTQSVRNRTAERGQAEIKENQINDTMKLVGDIASGKVIRDAAGEVGKTLAQGAARIPEQAFRSIFLEPLVGNAGVRDDQTISTASDENTGIREFLYGKDPVKSYQEQARDLRKTGKDLKQSDNSLLQTAGGALDTPFTAFVAPALAALDLSGVAAGGLPTTKAAVDAGMKQVEKMAGKKLSEAQAKQVAAQLETEIAKRTASPVVTPVATPKQGVIQIINHEKGTKEFIDAADAAYEEAVKVIDNARLANGDAAEGIAGTPQANGDIYHITAKTPEQMIAAGFTKRADSTIPTPTPSMPESSSTQRIADLIDIDAIRARSGVDVKAFDPTQYGVKPNTYDYLVKQYGEKPAQNLLASTSDATNIRNMDAFVTSEARKRYGEPKSNTAAAAQAQADIVNTELPVAKKNVKIVSKDGTDITAEINATDQAIKQARADGDNVTATNLQMKQLADLEDAAQRKPQDNAQYVAQQTAKLPSSIDATADDIPNIEKTMEDAQAHVTGFGDNTTPEQRTKLMQEIAQYDRDKTPISPESKQLYDEYIKPVVDAFYSKSKRSDEGNLGQKEYYLPEEKVGTEAKTFSPFGRGWIDEANLDFGHALRREGKIDTAELNDPVLSLHNYIEQFYNDNYGHLSPENIAEAQMRNVSDAGQYVKGRQELANKVDKSLVREVDLNVKNTKQKLKDSSDVVGDIQRNFDKSGGDPDSVITLNAKLPAASKARTNRKISQRITAGNNLNAYEAFGMRQYENAGANGNLAFTENFAPNEDLPEYAANLRGFYEEVYNRDFTNIMSKQRFDDMVDGAATKSWDEQDPAALQRLERNLAIEKAIYSSEHIRYSDPKTAAQINREVTHMLRDGKLPQTIARKITDEFTKMTYSGALGLNPLSAIQNLTELSRVAGITPKGKTFEALKKQLQDATIPKMRETLQEYNVTSSRIQQELEGSKSFTSNPVKNAVRVAGKGRDKVNEFVMSGFNATDAFKNYAMLKALEAKHSNIADPRLRREAIMDEFNTNSLLGGHYGNIEATNQNNFARAALQFGSYTMRDWGQIGEMAKKGDWGYVARTLGTRAGIAIPMYALFGTTLAYTLGVNEYKGGPLVSVATNAFQAVADEAQRVQEEVDAGNDASFDWANVRDNIAKKQGALTVPGGNYLLNKLGIQDLFGATKDLPFLRDDTTISDLQRGYNQNKDGRPRFAAPQDMFSTFKAIIGGAYNSNEAKKYFNTGFFDNPKLYGLFDTNKQTYTPVSSRYQKEIQAQSAILRDETKTAQEQMDARAKIATLIDSSYGDQDLKNKFFQENPEAANIYKEITKTVFNPETHKRETDVITPERWNAISSDKSGKLFEYLKNRAARNNAEFGDPIDPIFELKDQSKVNEVLALRAAFTGDDVERKNALRDQKWYQDFEKAQTAYYDAKSKQQYDSDSDFGNTKRAQQYFELSKQNPSFAAPKSELLQQYEAIRNSGDEAGRKAFYKANADALGAEYEKRSNDLLTWTNQMRALEGAEPISAEVWNNASYGYKSDEAALARQLAGEYGKSGGGYGGSGSGVDNANFGRTGASPSITVGKNYKAKTVKVKSKLAKSKIAKPATIKKK